MLPISTRSLKSSLYVLIIFMIMMSVSWNPTHARGNAQGFTTPPQINGIFTPDIIYPSETSRLTINVFNPNTSELTDVTWTDSLPDDLVLTSNPNPFVNGCGSAYILDAVAGTQTITLSNATTASTTDPTKPGICSVTVSVTSFTAGNHTNIIHTTDGSVTLAGSTVNYEYDANITLLVLPMTSPSVTKSFTPSQINEGETSQLRLNIRNNDANVTLTEVSLDDVLPTNMSIYNTTTSLSNCGGGILQGSTDGLTWHTVAANDTYLRINNASISTGQTCVVTATVALSDTGSYTNQIGAGDLVTYQKVTNPSAANATLTASNIHLDKDFTYNNFEVNGTSPVTITIDNPDLVYPITDLSFTDVLPSGMTAVSASGSVTGTGCSGTVDTDTDPTEIAISNMVVPAGGSCTINATVTAASSGSFTNTVYCNTLTFNKNGSAVTPGCTNASDTITVYPSTKGLTGVKSFSPSDIAPGTNSTLSIRITAPSDIDLTDVEINDHLPNITGVDDVRIASTSGTTSGCGSPTLTGSTDSVNYHSLAVGDTSIRLQNGSITRGSTCTITVSVTSSIYGPHTNTIAITDVTNAENRNLSANVFATLTVRDISVSKSFASDLIGKNGITTLTITLTNNYDYPLTDLAFTDALPASGTESLVVASTPNVNNQCGGSVTADPLTSSISLSNGSLIANTSCTITVDVQGLSSSATPSTALTNTLNIGDVTGNVNGVTPSQNWHSASDSITVGTPDFRINKKYDPILVTGDSVSTMTITLVNPGSSAVSGIAFTDTLPSHQLLASTPNPNTGTCGGTITPAADRQSFSFSGGSLPANGTCKLTIQAMMNVTGNTINTIPALAITTDQGATNLQSTSATLTNLSSVQITKKFSPSTVAPGNYTFLTLSIKKVGIGIGLTGLGFTDTLPTGLTVAGGNAPLPTNTCGGTLSASAGDTAITLSGGAMDISTSECTIVVPISAPSSGLSTYENCIAVGSITTNEGYTNVMETCDTLGTIFDPPYGYKVFNADNLPELEWRMVWINNSSTLGINVQIQDDIPTDTTYIPGSLVCQAIGVSSTTTCTYDAANNRVQWVGNIGPDLGATDEASAANEVIITFRVDVPTWVNQVNNRATSLTDIDDDGDFTDETTSASVSNSNLATWYRYSAALPNTGFAPNVTSILPEQPLEKQYTSSYDLSLEIPEIQVSIPVVGVPQFEDKWDVSWLGENAGWLNGTAYPGNEGNSVLTAHVYTADGLPGPFVNLKDLRYGDQVILHAWGHDYLYEVRNVLVVGENDTKRTLEHEDSSWITLLTCRNYNEQTHRYDQRTVVKAVLMEIIND